MALVFLVIFINSVQRYFFGSSYEWGEELPVYLAVYGVMFGMAWAYLSDRHVSFSLITNMLPKKFHLFINFIIDVCMVVIGALLCYSGYLFMMRRGKVDASSILSSARSLSETTGIDQLAVLGQMYPYYFAIVLGGAMLTIAAVLRLLNRFSATHEQDSEGAF